MDMIDQIISFAGQWYWVPLLLVYLAIILTILIENRNPTNTISWILVIVFLPVIGILVYYFFGQQFRKVRLFRVGNQAQNKRLMERWGRLNPIIEANLEHINQKIGSLSRVYRFLAHQHVSPLVLDNQVDLLINGEE